MENILMAIKVDFGLTIFREGGTMRMIYINENDKDGVINEWYKNGQKKLSCEYFHGQKNGLWTAWYPNGVKENVVILYQGKKEALILYFYDNGNRKCEGVVSSKGQKDQRCRDIYGNI
tara:strand:+ start:204 stop:557 length:354 start_codon:yes stop_codon:yes gene_type:complete